MATTCFCGCGRSVPFGRRRATNVLGAQVTKDVAMLTAAATATPQHAADGEAAVLRSQGTVYHDLLAAIVHGDAARAELDKPALTDWWRQAQHCRERLEQDGAEPDAG